MHNTKEVENEESFAIAVGLAAASRILCLAGKQREIYGGLSNVIQRDILSGQGD